MFSPDTGEFKPLPMYMGLKSSDPYGLIYDLEGDLSQTKPITKPTTGNDVSDFDDIDDIEPAFASDGEETKPQGLARVLAGIADIATGQKFDFDKRGRELINKNFDTFIKDKSANIGTAARLYKDYLGNKTDSGFVANNQYLGKEYINNTFLPNARFYNDSTHVGDNVVGNGQASTYNANTGRIKTTATFDFKTNAQEMEDQILSPRQKLFVKSLPALGIYKNVGLDYTLDSVPALTGTGFDTAAGAVFSAITSVAKQSGRGKTVPIEVEYTPRELYNKNPAGYTQLVDQGVIPDVMRVKYGHLYDTPYFKFKRTSKKSKVNESYSKSKSRLMKPKRFFNPKDIKPEFPPEPPEEIDPNTGMHPRYGKHAARYKKFDPMSANAMPPTGDQELDDLVDKQRTKKTPAERRKEYVKNFEKIKQIRRGS